MRLRGVYECGAREGKRAAGVADRLRPRHEAISWHGVVEQRVECMGLGGACMGICVWRGMACGMACMRRGLGRVAGSWHAWAGSMHEPRKECMNECLCMCVRECGIDKASTIMCMSTA